MIPTRAAALAALLGACAVAPDDLVPRTVAEDPTLPSIQLGDARFYLERRGAAEGTPIIFLAGGPGNDAEYMTRLAGPCGGEGLGARHPLVLWDQRGTGQSERFPDERLTYEVFAQDLDRLVDTLAPTGKVILVGHSWGGTFAASFANRRPDKLAGLVLLEPGQLSKAIEDASPTSFSFDPTAEWLNDFAWGSQILTVDDHRTIDFYALLAVRGAQPYRRVQEDPPTRRLGAAVIRKSFVGGFYPEDFDFTANLRALPLEVLIIAGNAPGADLGDDLQRRFHVPLFARATLEVIEGAGHTDVAWANACTSVALIRDYLARVEGRP